MFSIDVWVRYIEQWPFVLVRPCQFISSALVDSTTGYAGRALTLFHQPSNPPFCYSSKISLHLLLVCVFSVEMLQKMAAFRKQIIDYLGTKCVFIQVGAVIHRTAGTDLSMGLAVEE